MKIKLDENLPTKLADVLSKLGHDADTVVQEGLQGKSDEKIWAAAQKENRFLITQDLDFSDIHRFLPGMHQGILVVRLRDPGFHALLSRIQTLFETEPVENWKECFVVATENKIRVRFPEK